jgi:signal transduction histidine kinase
METFLLGAITTLLVIAVVRIAVARRTTVRSWRQPDTTAAVAAEDERRVLIEDAVARLDEGVVIFSDTFRLVLANDAARRMLRLGPSTTTSAPAEVMSLVRRAVTTNDLVEDQIDVWLPERTSLAIRTIPLGPTEGVVLLARDVTAERRAERMRKQFVTHASHELKSPVASMQSLAEAVAHAAPEEPDKTVRFANRLVQESQRLARLVDDLLDLSRVEDPASFSTESIDLSALVEEETATFGAEASTKEVALASAVKPGLWTIGDGNQLRLLVRNLLDNAIRYTPAGGRIDVELVPDDDYARFSVTDTGIGIPLKSQARVFERFYRVDEARSREHGGTGLGLAIVKHVADLYGGRVEVESEYGEGSTFTAYLPLAPDALAVEEGT